MPRHIPPGKEDLYRRQEQADAEVARVEAKLDAATKRRDDLVEALGWDDPLVNEADEEMAAALDEHNRAVAVADRVYQERMAGLSSWIDEDPTAPVCPDCHGAGGPPGADAHGTCTTCRGWGRESRPPIPEWDAKDQEWINPATGRTVDLLADPPKSAKPAPPTTTSNGGSAMPNIEEARAGVMGAKSTGESALAELAQAHSSLEDTQNALRHATEGSNQPEADQAHGLLADAMSKIDEARQQVASALAEFEGVGARL